MGRTRVCGPALFIFYFPVGISHPRAILECAYLENCPAIPLYIMASGAECGPIWVFDLHFETDGSRDSLRFLFRWHNPFAQQGCIDGAAFGLTRLAGPNGRIVRADALDVSTLDLACHFAWKRIEVGENTTPQEQERQDDTYEGTN